MGGTTSPASYNRSGSPNAVTLYRWGDEQIEGAGTFPAMPIVTRPDADLVFTRSGVFDTKGQSRKLHENSVVLPGQDGKYYAALVLGSDPMARGKLQASFFSLPGLERLDSLSYEVNSQNGYDNPFENAFLLSKQHLILGQTRTTFVEGIQVYFFPYDPATFGK